MDGDDLGCREGDVVGVGEPVLNRMDEVVAHLAMQHVLAAVEDSNPESLASRPRAVVGNRTQIFTTEPAAMADRTPAAGRRTDVPRSTTASASSI